MNNCKTCKHWQEEEDEYNEIIIPIEKNGATIIDGSQYHAELITAENFGCVNHESN